MTTQPDLFHMLQLRYEFEEIVRQHKTPFRDGTVDNMRWYAKNGHKSNRFRDDYQRAVTICKEVLSQ